MEEIKLNETPVRTSRNFNINNIKLDKSIISQHIGKFENVKILGQTSKINVEETQNNCDLTYGLGEILTNQIKEKANQNLLITIDSKINKELQIEFTLDSKNPNLLDNINIIANENSRGTVIIKYTSKENLQGFHNGIIKVLAKEYSEINILIINLTNQKCNNFVSVENTIENGANIKYTFVDFGGKNSITNYYSNLIGEKAANRVNTIYLGKQNQVFDLNYIGELRGEKSDIDIQVQGALKDNSKKHFKGTIDFKKGCKKSTGNEVEECMLLSETAKSLALPMLLCSEEDIEGNHSSSAGKIGEKELFYIMSRGFELKEAMKLMVRAKFNKVLATIKNEEIRNEIISEMNNRLD